MGQESAEKIKTSTSHGYQNGIEPDTIRNVKDFIVDENDFVIVAESPHKTLYKTRNDTIMGRLSIIDDLMDYCVEKQGTVQYGDQCAASIVREYDSTDFELSNAKKNFKANRLRSYQGWMRCINTDDDFEVKRKGRSKYFTISHKKEQLQGYALQWYIDYFDLEDAELQALNIGVWSYSALVQLGGICTYHHGTPFISNRHTKHKEISLNDYFIQQLDPLSSSKGYLLSAGLFSCTQSKEEKANFVYDIEFSKKYRKLIYTKRQ